MTSLGQLGIALKYMPVPRKVDPLREGKQASIRKEEEQRGKKIRQATKSAYCIRLFNKWF